MRSTTGFYVLTTLLLLMDIYIFQIVKYLGNSLSPRTKLIVFAIFWGISVLSIIVTLSFPYVYFNARYKVLITYAFSVVVGLFFFKILCTLFFLIDDIRRLLSWLYNITINKKKVFDAEISVSRSAFISWLGIGIGSTLFGSLLVGFTNKYNYNVKRIKLKFSTTPTAFKGIKIVQLSDIHSGSFDDKEAVAKGVQKVLDLKPDLILFTGDLVNNIASEMDDYTQIFAKLQAPLGVYSVLGNHDYGDYYKWDDRTESHREKEFAAKLAYEQQLNADATISESTKVDLLQHYRLYSPMQQKHLDDLKALQANMGWKLLLNEHVIIEKNNDKIALIGIENWGARANFPKYGRLDIAYKGTEQLPFKILMSHDPSHWDAQITTQYKTIDLTLAGHTHGMQFGIEIPGFRWSPIQYIYKQWAGIYQKQNQQLYVNRGFGFLGYPGRVGILPEITLIELV